MSPSESRRNPRLNYEDEVYLEENNEGHELRAFNLCLTGVGLHSPRRLGTGRMVQLSFLGRNMSVMGTVRRELQLTHPTWLVGVEFHQAQPELVDVISRKDSDAVEE